MNIKELEEALELMDKEKKDLILLIVQLKAGNKQKRAEIGELMRKIRELEKEE